MSGELLFKFDAARGIFDIVAGDAAGDADAALHSAVLASLFTDARARPEDRLPDEASEGAVGDPGLPPPAERNRRGFWAERDIGSLFWLHGRAKLTEATRLAYEDHARKALAWLIADKIASAIVIQATIEQPESLLLYIRIERPGNPALEFRFDQAWRGVAIIGGLTDAA